MDLSSIFSKPAVLPTPDEALPGRSTPISGLGPHLVLATPITPPFPEGFERLVVGMGCFWGAEELFGFGSPTE